MNTEHNFAHCYWVKIIVLIYSVYIYFENTYGPSSIIAKYWRYSAGRYTPIWNHCNLFTYFIASTVNMLLQKSDLMKMYELNPQIEARSDSLILASAALRRGTTNYGEDWCRLVLL